MDTKLRGLKSRTTRRRYYKSSSSSSSSPARFRTIHPRKLRPKTETPEDPESVDLIRTVICQGETIDKQMDLLNNKDDEIEYYETMIHMMRMEEVGVNYLLDTYLNDPEDLAAASSSVAECSERSLDGIQTAIALYENVLEVCRRIVSEEECIRDLSTQIRDTVSITEGNDRLTADIEKTKAEIRHLVTVNDSQKDTIDQNCRTIIECDRILAEKEQCLHGLQSELNLVEQENALLEQELYRLQWSESSGESSADSSPVRGQTDSFEGADSNSDTGISSLHSSSDDGAYVLDTLV